MTFKLAHLSDPHLNPLPRVRARDLMGKRATGFANWLRSRRLVHDMQVLDRIVADVASHEPDHVACTGDVTHIGLPQEFPTAVRFMTRLGPVEATSFVPGNHDAYVSSSLLALERSMAPWAQGDEGPAGYPWMKIRRHVALIGLSSAVPTGPLMAWGRVGIEQVERARGQLREAARLGLRRVVLIHHPPHLGGALAGRELKDAAAFEAMIEDEGADLVVHGHNHTTSLAWIAGPSAIVPVIGVASCSMGPRSHGEKAGWHLFEIPQAGPIALERRGLGPDGGIGCRDKVLLEKR